MKLKLVLILIVLFVLSSKINASISVYDLKTNKFIINEVNKEKLNPGFMQSLFALSIIEQNSIDDKLKASIMATDNSGDNRLGLVYNQEEEFEDLFKAATIGQYSDALNVLAESVSDDLANFINIMNIKAQSIGLSADSNFTNTFAKANDLNFVSKEDLFKLLIYLNDNQKITDLLALRNVNINFNNQVKMISNNFNYDKYPNFKYAFIDKYNKHTLAGLYEDNNLSILILISENASESEAYRRLDDFLNNLGAYYQIINLKENPGSISYHFRDVDSNAYFNFKINEDIKIYLRDNEQFTYKLIPANDQSKEALSANLATYINDNYFTGFKLSKEEISHNLNFYEANLTFIQKFFNYGSIFTLLAIFIYGIVNIRRKNATKR